VGCTVQWVGMAAGREGGQVVLAQRIAAVALER